MLTINIILVLEDEAKQFANCVLRYSCLYCCYAAFLLSTIKDNIFIRVFHYEKVKSRMQIQNEILKILLVLRNKKCPKFSIILSQF